MPGATAQWSVLTASIQADGSNKSGDVFLYAKSHLRPGSALPPTEVLRSFSIHGTPHTATGILFLCSWQQHNFESHEFGWPSLPGRLKQSQQTSSQAQIQVSFGPFAP